jgi:tetratricopeptide (TPR) repeat protein
MICTL